MVKFLTEERFFGDGSAAGDICLSVDVPKEPRNETALLTRLFGIEMVDLLWSSDHLSWVGSSSDFLVFALDCIVFSLIR